MKARQKLVKSSSKALPKALHIPNYTILFKPQVTSHPNALLKQNNLKPLKKIASSCAKASALGTECNKNREIIKILKMLLPLIEKHDCDWWRFP